MEKERGKSKSMWFTIEIIVAGVALIAWAIWTDIKSNPEIYGMWPLAPPPPPREQLSLDTTEKIKKEIQDALDSHRSEEHTSELQSH